MASTELELYDPVGASNPLGDASCLGWQACKELVSDINAREKKHTAALQLCLSTRQRQQEEALARVLSEYQADYQKRLGSMVGRHYPLHVSTWLHLTPLASIWT